jgi:hypothetical protein
MKDNTTCNTPIKIFNCSIRALFTRSCEALSRTNSDSPTLSVAVTHTALVARLYHSKQTGCIWQSLPRSCVPRQGPYNKHTKFGTELRPASNRRICQSRVVAVTVSLVAAQQCHWPIRMQR